MQKTVNGNVLRLTNGNLMKECCCGTGPQPSTCPNGYPEINVTVTWTGSPPELVGGQYPWLGQTFNNGDTKIICPDWYTYGSALLNTTWSNFPTSVPGMCIKHHTYRKETFFHTWDNSGSERLKLVGKYLRYYATLWYGTEVSPGVCGNLTPGNTFKFTYGRKSIDIVALGGVYFQIWKDWTPIGGSVTNSNLTGVASDNINQVAFTVYPRPVKIQNNQFGMLTTNSGVTITWAKGNGW